MKALSVKQPWAWLICNGYKDIENRNWATDYRGEFLIHASKNLDQTMLKLLMRWSEGMSLDISGFLSLNSRPDLMELARKFRETEVVNVGGIVGKSELIDCVTGSSSPWFKGKYGFVLQNSQPLPYLPCRGMLSFFEPKINWEQS